MPIQPRLSVPIGSLYVSYIEHYQREIRFLVQKNAYGTANFFAMNSKSFLVGSMVSLYFCPAPTLKKKITFKENLTFVFQSL